MKFRKKPVVIEAEQFDGTLKSCTEISKWMGNVQLSYSFKYETIEIPTLEGIMTANPGNWIIKGVQGEFYPCREDIFEKTYERVKE